MLKQKLNPLLIEQINAMRADKIPWRKIADTVHVGEFIIRCACEPGFREYRQRLLGQHRDRTRKPPTSRLERHEVRFKHTPPDDVLAARDLAAELMLAPRSLTAQLLGDPLPGTGRSALEQQQQRKSK